MCGNDWMTKQNEKSKVVKKTTRWKAMDFKREMKKDWIYPEYKNDHEIIIVILEWFQANDQMDPLENCG